MGAIEHPPGETLYGRHMREFQRAMVDHYLRANHGNLSAAARTLGIHRSYMAVLVRTLSLREAGGASTTLSPTSTH